MEPSVNILKFAEARATEIFSLMEEVTSKEAKLTLQRLPYHMRRRIASHNPKRLPRSLRMKKSEETPAKPKKKKKCHKNLLEEYNSRQKPDSLWLPTHIWFAKRFHMKTMWGYQLPMQATGKRFRSSYRATVKNVLIQDLSYFCCIELKGDRKKLLSHLSLLTEDSLGLNFAAESYMDGTKEGSCFIYHPQSFPYHAIGPVSFMWNPSCSLSSINNKVNNESIQQLWIWCHPTIHEELINVLIEIFHLTEQQGTIIREKVFASKTNFEKTKLHFQKEPVYSSCDVTMIVLKDTLVRHRLIGPNTLSILTSVLKLADSDQLCKVENNSDVEMMEMTASTSKNVIERSGSISSTVNENLLMPKQKVWKYLSETKSSYTVPIKAVIGLTVNDPRIYVTPRDSDFCRNGNTYTGDISILDEFDDPATAFSEIWNQDIRNEVTASQVPEHVINRERAKYVNPHASDLQKCTSNVPVILIHQPEVNGYGSGWDIIAPQGWGMAFWIPFIYHGAQPAGFNDYCSINLESGRATFPCSFPDTKAGATFEENTRETSLKKFYKYSRAKRPNFKILGIVAPFFMPWNVLVSDWEKEFSDKYLKDLTNISSTEDKHSKNMSNASSTQNKHSKCLSNVSSSTGAKHSKSLDSISDTEDKHPQNLTNISSMEDKQPKNLSKVSSTEDKHPNSLRNVSSKEDIFATSCSDPQRKKEFFTLRSRKEIMELRHLCLLLAKFCKCSMSDGIIYKNALNTSVQTLSRDIYLKSIIVVRVKCLSRGIPSVFSGIYLPRESDLKCLKENPKYFGPVETQHNKDDEYSCFPAKKRRKILKEEAKLESKKLDRPEIETVISCSNYKIIGYVSEGGYSRLGGHGYGVGHCALTGFLTVLKVCMNLKIGATVLVREQHNFQYRPASIEVIENPF